jgi:hypothetical protein
MVRMRTISMKAANVAHGPHLKVTLVSRVADLTPVKLSTDDGVSERDAARCLRSGDRHPTRLGG